MARGERMIEGKDYDSFESLEEMIESIDIGLDLEFYLYGVRYNISTNRIPFICICPDGDAEYYKDGTDLMNHHKVNNRKMKDIWRDVQIISF